MRYLGRSILTVGLATSLTLLLPGGAVGELTNATDPPGDVVTVEIDAGPNLEHHATVRPTIAHGDIRTLHANHAHTRVFAGLRFRNINPDKWLAADFAFRTPQARFLLEFSYENGRVRWVDWYNETRDAWPRCGGIEIRVNTSKDRIRVYVPRACLNRPRWVKVGAQADGRGYDDALRRGRNDRDWLFDGPALGPRLSRGPLL